MIIKKGTNRITLLKFLLAKLVHSEEGIHIEEYLLIYHLYFDLEELGYIDPLFLKKHSDFLETLGVLLSNNWNKVNIFPMTLTEKAKELMRENFPELPTKRAYQGLQGQRDLKLSYKLVLNDTIIPRKMPPKRFIGVGYKDKGSRRDPAFDGSPSWQEVARTFCNQERELEELDSSNFPSQDEEE